MTLSVRVVVFCVAAVWANAESFAGCRLIAGQPGGFHLYCPERAEVHVDVQGASAAVVKVPQTDSNHSLPSLVIGRSGVWTLITGAQYSESADRGSTWSRWAAVAPLDLCSATRSSRDQSWIVMKASSGRDCAIFEVGDGSQFVLASSSGISIQTVPGAVARSVLRLPVTLELDVAEFGRASSATCVGERCWLLYGSGYLLKSADRGLSWDLIAREGQLWRDPATIGQSKIQFVTDSIGYLLGEDRVLRRSADGGKTWMVLDALKGRVADFLCTSVQKCHVLDVDGRLETLVGGRL